MSDPLYEVVKDLVVPGLAGIGGILVGVGATVVASRSNDLAEQVRSDEGAREAAAARDRYRDQLFRSVEPAVAALLDHRDRWERSHEPGVWAGPSPVSNVMSRLNLLFAVANEEDQKFVAAVIDVYGVALSEDDLKAKSDLLASLAVALPRLLAEKRDIAELVRKVRVKGSPERS